MMKRIHNAHANVTCADLTRHLNTFDFACVTS